MDPETRREHLIEVFMADEGFESHVCYPPEDVLWAFLGWCEQNNIYTGNV